MTGKVLELKRLDNFFLLKRGHDLPSQDRQAGSIPVISSSGITGFHSEAKAKGPGVVTGRYGTLGEVFYQEGHYWPLNTTLYVYDFKGNNPHFVYYFLKALDFEHLNSAAAVPGLDRNVLHSIKVNFPILPAQNKIAAILATYDELIANNSQRIKLLEEMAEEIYKEWFVRLRFPGHEQTRIVDGLPEGWKNAPLVKNIDILSGGTPKTDKSEFWNGKIPFFSPKDCTGDLFCFETENCISETGLRSCNSDLFPEDTIIITARGTVGNIVITGVPMAMNQSCFALSPKAGFTSCYIYHFIKHIVTTLKQVANGATFDAITVRTFELTKGIMPVKDLVVQFDKTVHPLLEQVKVLLEKNKILKQTRDLLLPRLMSGRLTIDHLPEP